jgi:ElaA protein
MSTLTWTLKFFDDLSLHQLYALGHFRQVVFVVEQDCPYVDFDNKDQKCWHLWAADETGELVAYTRIIPPGISYEEVSIGRVITSQKVRGQGVGKKLMERSIDACAAIFGRVPVRISAQSYLLKFYTELGFENTGKSYLEDGIPHNEMYLTYN